MVVVVKRRESQFTQLKKAIVSQTGPDAALICVQELEKLVMVAMCSFKVIINLTWVMSRELLHANIAKLITWVILGPEQASVLS